MFHDASNNQKKEVEGKEGAKIAESVLRTISDFPRDKISDVKRLIVSINADARVLDEVLINTADEMAALSSLGLVRSLMISGNKGMKVRGLLNGSLITSKSDSTSFDWKVPKDLLGEHTTPRKSSLETY